MSQNNFAAILKDMDVNDLAAMFAKNSVAYDELEELGSAFWDKIDENHPRYSEKFIFGCGLKGNKLLNLVYRYKRGFKEGTDEQFCFFRDLASGLRGTRGFFISDCQYEIVDSHYLLQCGDVRRILTYEQVAEAYLALTKEEYKM